MFLSRIPSVFQLQQAGNGSFGKSSRASLLAAKTVNGPLSDSVSTSPAVVFACRPEIIKASAGDWAEQNEFLSHSIKRPALCLVLGKLDHDPEGNHA